MSRPDAAPASARARDPEAVGDALADAVPTHAAEALVGRLGVARIVLDGQVYTLRVTRARKLILTK